MRKITKAAAERCAKLTPQEQLEAVRKELLLSMLERRERNLPFTYPNRRRITS